MRDTATRIARRTWWLPWLIGAAVVPVGAATALQALSTGQPLSRTSFELPRSAHRVVYEVTGSGSAPEIRYVTDGVNRTETLRDVPLPWRLELDLEVGPALGVAQVTAASPVGCSVSVDGVVVHTADAPEGWASVSCSSVIRP
ncbi:MmpS family transport accessory protein [Amycolatopsis thermoflava]|uniref:MmpS family transport accessory protein n=1 Tax=Amycolatopsis thermoflava TaxID=84480 RepID=UPI0037F991BB